MLTIIYLNRTTFKYYNKFYTKRAIVIYYLFVTARVPGCIQGLTAALNGKRLGCKVPDLTLHSHIYSYSALRIRIRFRFRLQL